MATFTSSLAGSASVAKVHYAGPTDVSVRFLSTAGTVSDIYLLAKVPNGALITRMMGRLTHANALSAIKLGWKAQATTSETAFGTHTMSASGVATPFDMADDGIARVHVSFSDSTGEQLATVFATASLGTFSQTVSLDLNFTFHVDHNE